MTANIIFILNLLDAILTSIWVGYGIADEANPVMAALINYSIPLFIAFKLTIGCVAWYAFYNFRGLTVTKVCSGIALAMYSYITGIHAFVFYMYMTT